MEKSNEENRAAIVRLSSFVDKDITIINQDIEDMKGPLATTLADIRKENEALLRELERTQTLNREMALNLIKDQTNI